MGGELPGLVILWSNEGVWHMVWHVMWHIMWHTYLPAINSPKPNVMEFVDGNLYHIYNRGNNRTRLFFNHENYTCFLNKVREYMVPVCDIINYSLMPNHFHFLIHANSITETVVKRALASSNVLSEAIRNLLSSYAKILNHQQDKTGNLFQQNTNAKCLTSENAKKSYSNTCFHYIHQNAWKAGLVPRMEEWEYCSFLDYMGVRKKTFCNLSLGCQLLDLDLRTFYKDSYGVIDTDTLSFLY